MFNTALILHHSLCFTLFALCWFTSPSSLVLWLLPHCLPFPFHKLSIFVFPLLEGFFHSQFYATIPSMKAQLQRVTVFSCIYFYFYFILEYIDANQK